MGETNEKPTNNQRKFDEQELIPNQEEQARSAVSRVFKDETTQLIANYAALTKRRYNLIEKLYDNVEKLNGAVFDDENFALMTLKEKLFALSIHLKSIATLTVTLPEHQETIKQINIQVNQMMSDENRFKDIPMASRERIRIAMEGMLTKIVNGINDNSMLDLEKGSVLIQGRQRPSKPVKDVPPEEAVDESETQSEDSSDVEE